MTAFNTEAASFLGSALVPANTLRLDPGGTPLVRYQANGNATFQVPQASPGTVIQIIFEQDATGGRTATWTGVDGTTVSFPGAGTGAPATLANQISLFSVIWSRANAVLITKEIA